MKKSIRSTRFGVVLFAGAMAFGASAQNLEASPAPEVGDKWTYRFHNRLLVTDTQPQDATFRRLLRAGQRQL